MVRIDENGKQHYDSPLSSGPQERQINGLVPTLALFGVLNAYLSNSRLPVVRPIGNITENNEPFLTLAAIPYTKFTPGSPYFKPLLDVGALNASVSSTFAGILSLLVTEQMLQPSNQSIQGDIQYSEFRLHVKKIPSIIITTFFFICFVLAVGMLFVSAHNIVPTNPNSIGGTAMIMGPISGMKPLSETSLAKVSQSLKGREFRSTVSTPGARTDEFSIISTPTVRKIQPGSTDTKSKPAESIGWNPITLRMWVRVSAALLCLGIIVGLELLQRQSDRFNGIIKTTPSKNTQLWATIVPAFALTGVALLYSSIYTDTSVLAPYHALASKSGAPAKRSIATQYAGSTPLFVLISSVRQGHVSTSLSAFAAIVGAFLAVVVSGLYTVQSINFDKELQVQRSNDWNVSWPLGDTDGSAGQVLQFITWRNLSEPQWTYDNLVFPIILLPPSVHFSKQQKLTVTLPARRAVLDCAVTKPADNIVGISYGSTAVYSSVVNTCSGQSNRVFPLQVFLSGSPASYSGSNI
jgi:hypothetical protein